MSEWVVSMHGEGGVGENLTGSEGGPGDVPVIALTEGTTIYFYTSEGAALSNHLAWPLFHLLMGTVEQIEYARSLAVEVSGPGSRMVDYTLIGADDWSDGHGSASGVFEAGNRFGPESWVLTKQHTFTLSWLLTQCAPGDSIHWLACRLLSWPAWCAMRRGTAG